MFNLNLPFIRHISTSPQTPWWITISSNQLYVGTLEGITLVYQNEILIQKFDGCNGNMTLLSSNGYMATSCEDSNKLYLFSPDGSFTNKSITTYPEDWSYYIGFDSKGRFILISAYRTRVYNLTFKLIYFLMMMKITWNS